MTIVLHEIGDCLCKVLTFLLYFVQHSVYTVANELLRPFGTEPNALDIDGMSHALTADVLCTAALQQPAFSLLHDFDNSPSEWSSQFSKPTWSPPEQKAQPSRWERFKKNVVFALIAVPLWQLVMLLIWSGVVFAFSFGLTKISDGGFDDAKDCTGRWFCNLVGVSSEAKMFIGVALFLLLGAQINNAHGRFVQAQTVWFSGVVGNVVVLANRLVQAVKSGTFHEGDAHRIAGHVAAVPPAIAARLRHGEGDSKDVLKRDLSVMLGEKDVEAVLKAGDPVGHLLDVIRSYLFFMETLNDTTEAGVGISYEEIFNMYFAIERLQTAAGECLELAKLSPPYGFRVHIAVLLTLWLFILPLGVVRDSGWLAIIWTMLIGYGLLGVLRWADELVDPFGCDKSDLPVHKLAFDAVDAVRELTGLFPNGSESILEEATARPSLDATILKNNSREKELFIEMEHSSLRHMVNIK